VIDVLKATIEGLEYTPAERGDSSDIISERMALTVAQGVKRYDPVKDTLLHNRAPTKLKMI